MAGRALAVAGVRDLVDGAEELVAVKEGGGEDEEDTMPNIKVFSGEESQAMVAV